MEDDFRMYERGALHKPPTSACRNPLVFEPPAIESLVNRHVVQEADLSDDCGNRLQSKIVNDVQVTPQNPTVSEAVVRRDSTSKVSATALLSTVKVEAGMCWGADCSALARRQKP